MAAPVQTLLLDPHYTISRSILHPAMATPVGGGASQFRRRYQRPCYGFTLKDSHATQASAEYLYSFMAYHGGDIPFFWSGNIWGIVSTPILVGWGDGVRTEFFLPNRHVEGPGLIVYHQGPPVLYGVGTWGINEETAIVTFDDPPADGAQALLRLGSGAQFLLCTGDGVTVAFNALHLLPYFNDDTALYSQEAPDPYTAAEWALDEAPGLVTLDVALTDQARLSAQYLCSYLCVFEVEGAVLQDEQLVYAQLLKYEGVRLREVVP